MPILSLCLVGQGH